MNFFNAEDMLGILKTKSPCCLLDSGSRGVFEVKKEDLSIW